MALAVLLIIAGLLIMVGSKELGAKALRAAIGLAFILSALPIVLACCSTPSVSGVGGAIGRALGLVVLVLVLAVVGLIVWRTRAARGRAREAAARRHGHPRHRLPPPPPRDSTAPPNEEWFDA